MEGQQINIYAVPPSRRATALKKWGGRVAIALALYQFIPGVKPIVNLGVSSLRAKLCTLQHQGFSRLQCYVPGVAKRLRNAIVQQESAGDYHAINPHSGALGAGQIMPVNLPNWSREVLGREVSQTEFLASEDIQNQIIDAKLSEYIETEIAKGFSEEEAIARAASTWYSGDPDAVNSTRTQYTDGNAYPSIALYSDTVLARYEQNEASDDGFNLPQYADIGAMAMSLIRSSVAATNRQYTIATPYLYDNSPPGSWDFTLIDPVTQSKAVPVPAPCAGQVSESGWSDRPGNYIRIDCNRGDSWYMAHFQDRDVERGDWVTKGQSLGIQGSTGNSTGPHVHLVITPKGGDRHNRQHTKPLLDKYFEQIQ